MRKVKWGVLGRRQDRRREGHPGDAAGRGVAYRGDRLARSRQGAGGRGQARHRARVRLLRGAARRPRDRGGLQSAAQRAACAVDAAGARRRQARAVREADRARRRGGAHADRGARSLRQARRRGLHGALPSAVAPRAGTGRNRRGRANCARSRPSSPIACSTPTMCATSRRAAAALYDIGCYAILSARYIFGAEPTRVVATIDRDPNFRTDRSASAILEFPGGRHSTFTVGTQIVGAPAGDDRRRRGTDRDRDPVQRAARPADGNRRSTPAPILFGGGRRVEQFPVCDQYTLQGDAFSRAILGGTRARIPDRGRDR